MDLEALQNDIERNEMQVALTAIAKEIQSANIPINNIEGLPTEVMFKNYNLKGKDNKLSNFNRRTLTSHSVSIFHMCAKQKINNAYTIAQPKKRLHKHFEAETVPQILEYKNIEQVERKNTLVPSLVHNSKSDETLQVIVGPTRDMVISRKLRKIFNNSELFPINLYGDCDKCKLLKQKNRFLRSKIKILEHNLKSLENQMKNLSFSVKKLQKGVSTTKISIHEKPNSTSSFGEYSKNISNARTDYAFEINLENHLSIVNGLLYDQKLMLQDLQALAEKTS